MENLVVLELRGLVQEQNWTEAVDVATKLSIAGVSDSIVNTVMAVGFYHTLEYRLAIDAANTALSKDSSDNLATVIISKSLFAMGYHGLAQDYLKSRSQDGREIALLEARAAFAEHDLSRMREMASSCLGSDQNDKYAHSYLLLGDWLSFRDVTARKALSDVFLNESFQPAGRLMALGFEYLQDLRGAARAWRDCASKDPSDLYAQFAQIRIDERLHGPSSALKLIDEMPSRVRTLTECIFLEAWLLSRQKRLAEAEALCWYLMRRNPEDRRFIRLMNWVLINRRRWQCFPRFLWMGILSKRGGIAGIHGKLSLGAELKRRKAELQARETLTSRH